MQSHLQRSKMGAGSHARNAQEIHWIMFRLGVIGVCLSRICRSINAKATRKTEWLTFLSGAKGELSPERVFPCVAFVKSPTAISRIPDLPARARS